MKKQSTERIAGNFYNRFHNVIEDSKKQAKNKKSIGDQHNIFEDHIDSDHDESQESSFALNDDKQQNQKKNQTISKVLDRLGLKTRAIKHKNQQLEMIVGNIVENCVGVIQTDNTSYYDKKYETLYKQKQKQNTRELSIIVNEFTDLQKIQFIEQSGFKVVYKFILLFLKKISQIAQYIAEHSLFEGIILIIIILNSVQMVLDDPLSTQQSSPVIKNIFIVLYTLQMIIKVFAFGFVLSPNSYLRDPWNILDFVIVSTSLLPYLITINFSVNSLRAIRVLRPLKTITKIKALKMIVQTLFHSFSLVMDSLYILFFVMVVFAIAGTQLFSGLLKNRCLFLQTGSLTDELCTLGTCSEGYLCVRGIESPNFSINNFDTFLWSLESVFRILTLEGWSQIMVDLQKVYNEFAAIYLILIIFFCQYVLLNMTLAILKYKYSQVKGNTIQQQQVQKTDYQPDFLKKLGIFKMITKITPEPRLQRYLASDKIFVGSSYFFKPSMQIINPLSNSLKNLQFHTKKISDKIVTKNLMNEPLNIQQLKKYGQIQESKWDPKTLVFQSELKNEVDPDNKGNSPTFKSIKSIQSIQDPSPQNVVHPIQQEESNSEQEESVQHSERQDEDLYINDKIFEINKKLGKSSKDIDNKTKNKEINEIELKAQKKNTQMRQLDHILNIVTIKPLEKFSFQLNIPEVDLNQVQVNELYERFNDLGDFRLKRIENNQLDYFNINHQRFKPEPIKQKVINVVKDVTEETTLEFKQLQLVNDLSKKQLKCRIKPINEINNSFTYEVSRVLISNKQKDLQKKKKQLETSIENLNFIIKYELDNKQQNESKYFRKVVEASEGLKIPQFENDHEKDKEKVKIIQKKQKKQENEYLRLLQSHQMEQKIENSENRLMQVFFKKQKPIIQPLIQINLEEQYRSIKQGDIYIRNGRVNIVSPSTDLSEEIIQSINIKPEQYQIYVKGFFGLISVLRKKSLLFINTGLYDNTMLLFVAANTVILSLNGLVDTEQTIFINLNMMFTFVFTVDLSLKIFSYGTQFFGDIMNLFDSLVVSISLVELSIGSGTSNLSALRSIRILRAFRVLRITRLVRTLKFMRIVMAVVSSVITQFVYVFMLLGLFVFIYTLLGMQIFGGQFLPESITGVRQNFNSLFNALFCVFQVLTTQNWNDIETAILTSKTGVISVIYLISLIFIGNWILLNLIQAILLDGFDKDSKINDQNGQDLIKAQIKENQQENEAQQSNSQQEEVYSDQDNSILIFPADNWFRSKSTTIINSSYFQNFIIIMILLSSLKLVADTYFEDGSKQAQLSNYFDTVFNFVFIFESLLKIIAKGLIMGKNAYLKDSWSKLDFFIVMSAVIDMSLGVDLSILKLFRTLRPLRIISRNQDMKIIISSLVQSISGVLNVLVIILSVFLMFGILGINLLQGKLNYCNDTAQLNFGYFGPYNVNQSDCQAKGGVWTTQFINFDNIGSSLLSMYVFSTRQNWPYYVYTFFDADQNGPVRDNSTITYMLLSVIIIFVCSYFFMDLVIGVLFMNFHVAEAKFRPKTLTDKQINWKNLQKVIIQQNPCFELYLKPSGKIRTFFYNIISWKRFDLFITFCIISNIIVMLLSQDDQSISKTILLDRFNFVFSLIFISEMVMKLIAFSKSYFLSSWNIFDFFVVCASIMDLILSNSGIDQQKTQALSILPQIARIFRVMRITRLLRMFKRFKGLQKLIETFIFSMSALGKGLGVIFLFMFIGAVLSSYLFGDVLSDYSGNINQSRNFHNFHNSLQLLFVMTTGQNWYFYMYETIQPGYVVCKAGVNCTQPYFLLFWVIYIFMSQKVFMELFVLIVLDQFEANYINENNPLGIFSLFEEDFRENWIQCTAKYHSEKIQVKKLVDLIMLLKEPLGLGKRQLMAKYEEELKDNENFTEESIQVSLSELDLKLKKNAAKLVHKMNIIKNRMYLGYHETFYHFAKLSTSVSITQNATALQKQTLESIHKQSQAKLEEMVPQGNLFYYDNAKESLSVNDSLNPIQLILFCQMVIKSWHNYSVKFHSGNRKNKKKNQNENKITEGHQSLNESCSSDIQEAVLQKIPNIIKKNGPRKGLIEKSDLEEPSYEFKIMPNVLEHYSVERKKPKNKNSLKRSSRNSAMLKIEINGQTK